MVTRKVAKKTDSGSPCVVGGIDWGARKCGVAIVVGGRVLRADVVHAPSPLDMPRAVLRWFARHERVDVFVSEKMRDYPGKSARSRDLETLRDVSAGFQKAIATHYGPRKPRFREMPAAKWKGTVKKAVLLERVRRKLLKAEIRLAAVLDKESLDAIGLAWFEAGELPRGMIGKRASVPRRKL